MAGLGYAGADGLEDGDAEIYAGAFADAKALGIGNADARAYASGVVYHAAAGPIDNYFPEAAASLNNIPLSEEEVQAALLDYSTAFEAAVIGDVPLPIADALGRASEAARRNFWWPFSFVDAPINTFAENYALAFTQTDAAGVEAHGYASIYAGYIHSGDSDDSAANLANADVRGYERSRATSVRQRLDYAIAYRRGYGQAVWRAKPEQGYTDESHIYAWAGAYADAYGRGLSEANNNGWDNPILAAYDYALVFAHLKVDMKFPDQDAYLGADSLFRGRRYASERASGDDVYRSYAWGYYSGYFDKKVRDGWSEERAHIYALSYADAKLAGREDQDAATYATAYEEAYTSRKEQGATDEDAHLYAAAFADAKLGS